MEPVFSYQLKLDDLRLWVHLGVSAQEQAVLQAISINLHIEFSKAPLGVKTDQVTDTFCYDAMTRHIKAFVLQHQPFALIEHLGGCIYACVYHDLFHKAYTDAQLQVDIKKLAPPVADVHGGITFSCRGVLNKEATDDLYRHWF